MDDFEKSLKEYTDESALRLEGYLTSAEAGDNREFYLHIHELAEARDGPILLALNHVAASGLGATLRREGRDQWATLFPDPGESGGFRWQMYGPDGFHGHGTHATLFQAAKEAAEDGFTQPDDGAPMRIFPLPSFEMGNRIAALIQSVNSGQLAWDKANIEAARIRAEYDAPSQPEAAPDAAASTTKPQTGRLAFG